MSVGGGHSLGHACLSESDVNERACTPYWHTVAEPEKENQRVRVCVRFGRGYVWGAWPTRGVGTSAFIILPFTEHL